ncbi:MAG: PEP-CTERM sorting domain-containing protein [Verrucomicrobiota bacterium]
MHTPLKTLLASSTVFALSATLASASLLTPVQTINFGGSINDTFVSIDDSQISVDTSSPFTGFQKFDPSLGTLKQVLLTAQVSVEVSYLFEASDVFDVDEPFTAGYEPGFNDLVQTSVIYRPNDGFSGFAVTFDLNDVPVLGAFDEDPQNFIEDDFFFFTDEAFDSYGAFGIEGLPSEGVIFSTDDEFVESDFVGSGEVTTLSLDSFVELNEMATLDNHGEPSLTITVEIVAGEATLQYEFIPIPEPSTYAMIFGAGALGLVLLRRRPLR